MPDQQPHTISILGAWEAKPERDDFIEATIKSVGADFKSVEVEQSSGSELRERVFYFDSTEAQYNEIQKRLREYFARPVRKHNAP